MLGASAVGCWYLIWPRQFAATQHWRRIRLLLERGSLDGARTAYAALRELADQSPQLPGLRITQILSMRKFLWPWIRRCRRGKPVTLAADEAAVAEELWRDLCAVAKGPEPVPQVRHAMMRALTPYISVAIHQDREHAIEVLRLMRRFSDHCEQCRSTYWHEQVANGKRLGLEGATSGHP